MRWIWYQIVVLMPKRTWNGRKCSSSAPKYDLWQLRLSILSVLYTEFLVVLPLTNMKLQLCSCSICVDKTHRSTTDLYQIDWKQRRSRPSDRKSRAPGADRPRPQREFARAPLAASNSTDTTAFATGYIACTVHMSLNIALQTTWLCT